MIGSTNITQGFAFSKGDEDNVLKTGIEIKGEEMKRNDEMMIWNRSDSKKFPFSPNNPTRETNAPFTFSTRSFVI